MRNSSQKSQTLTLVAYVSMLIAIAMIASTQVRTAVNAAEVKAVAPAASSKQHFSTAATQPKTRAQELAAKRGKLTAKELSEVLTLAGFKGKAHKTAWAIAMRESSGRPTAYNGNSRTGDKSYGIFQINMIGDLGPARRAKYKLSTNAELFNPVKSAKVAFLMSKGGRDFGAWGIGPNAYRAGAGESTIRKFYSKYPGIR